MSTSPIPWKHVRNILVLFAPLWCGTTILFGLAGALYALFSGDVWSARQPLVIRDQASVTAMQSGRFGSTTELKAAQETILEMAQNPEVVRGAMRQIGPPTSRNDMAWPPNKLVDEVAAENVNIRAPQGSEFGDSEVLYLEVKESSPERAEAFCRAMYDHLAEHHRRLRRLRADSLVNELTHTRNLAKQNLDEAAGRIREIEVEFGSDLGELRNLNDTISGDGTTRRTLEEVARELQVAELELSKLDSLHNLLVAGSDDPTTLVISGGDLLAMQPSLQRLKDGLIDAQIATSRLSGNYRDIHPKRRAANSLENELREQIRQEAATAIQAMQPTLTLGRDRVARLKQRRDELTQRLTKLAHVRTTYASIDAQMRQRTQILGDSEKALTEAQADRDAAMSTNLIAELGPPQVGDQPVGPSGSVLSVGSAMAGLIFGLGTVFLVAPGPTDGRRGRRWSDYLKHGRRASDIPPDSNIAPPKAAPLKAAPSNPSSTPIDRRRR